MVENLKFYADGKEHNFLERIRQDGAKFYTDIGVKTWRVPPVKFNVTKTSFATNCSVLDKPQQTDQETNSAENIVCGTFENLSKYLVDKRTSSAMFIVSNFEYDNYLNKIKLQKGSNSEVLTLPRDKANRGELDILILHQTAGILLVQTKAVGYNFLCSDYDLLEDYITNIEKAVEKAIKQLIRDCKVIIHVTNDLQLKETQLTKLIALPKLKRNIFIQALSKCERLKSMISENHLDPDLHFLCKEDFLCDESGHQKTLEKWWVEKLLKHTKGISLDSMKEIAYRTVGLMSTVSVWSSCQPRMEVRNLNDAAWETGNRFTQVLLSRQQAELLKNDEQYFYVWGPAGSGKTLLLSLKGHQWLKNHLVAILNTRLGSKGRTVGHVMETTINKTIENSSSKKNKLNKAMRIDIDLAEEEAKIETEVLNNVDKEKKTMFLIDEVTWIPETEKLIMILKRHFSKSSIWCAGMLPECKPLGFESQELQSVLRCPPSVQRVLRLVDNRMERRMLYQLESSRAGLHTDGPSPYFIIHSEHGSPSVQPYDCAQCGDILSDFLLSSLNLKTFTSVERSQSLGESASTDPCHSEGCRLHFNEAVVAVSMPQSWHHSTDRGYWAISKEALHSNMMLLGSGPFCETLLDRKIPLRVEGAMTFTPEKNVAGQRLAMCPIGSVHGLEYKVVVCIPSARDLPEFTEINFGIINGERSPREPMKRLSFAAEIMKKRQESLNSGPTFCTCFLSNGSAHLDNLASNSLPDGEPKSDKIRISTHVHGDYNGWPKPSDLLYEKCEGEKVVTPTITIHHPPQWTKGVQKVDMYPNSSACLKRLKDEVCGDCDTESCVCKYFKPEELVALHRLDKWDKAYVLMCASRCTSQLILVLP